MCCMADDPVDITLLIFDATSFALKSAVRRRPDMTVSDPNQQDSFSASCPKLPDVSVFHTVDVGFSERLLTVGEL